MGARELSKPIKYLQGILLQRIEMATQIQLVGSKKKPAEYIKRFS